MKYLLHCLWYLHLSFFNVSKLLIEIIVNKRPRILCMNDVCFGRKYKLESEADCFLIWTNFSEMGVSTHRRQTVPFRGKCRHATVCLETIGLPKLRVTSCNTTHGMCGYLPGLLCLPVRTGSQGIPGDSVLPLLFSVATCLLSLTRVSCFLTASI